jgi:uncharacterized protein (DUF952 family)
MIYKICTDALWTDLPAHGETLGSDHDRRDGFLHFSTASQLQGTFEKYYAQSHAAGEALWLLSVPIHAFDTALRWESSRDGQPFPHLYGRLHLHHVAQARRIVSLSDLVV